METIDPVAPEIQNENPYQGLVVSVRNELESLGPLYGECTIHRVRESIRQLDEKAYIPRVVSIGPIHNGKQELKAMEEYKRRYLQNFLQRTEVSLEDFIKLVKEKEEDLRNCYAETIELGSDNFVKMVLMDATFIFEVLLTHFNGECLIYDRVYGNPLKFDDVRDDLYLLENQLPFFILKGLFSLADIKRSTENEERLSILQIAYDFTKTHWDNLGMEENCVESNYSKVKHLLDLLRISIVPLKKKQTEGTPEILTTPSVTELHQAGVKFKLGSSKNLFDMRFSDGILEIPRISIRGSTENVMKNLLAFEKSQCEDLFLNDYIIFMNYLVNSPRDADILVQGDIIQNPIGDSERVSSLFHRLNERPVFSTEYFHFSCLVEELNRYCKTPWYKWRATLKQDYFKTPWTTISVIAAVMLLVLTLIQSICSILQVA